ncbi:hypothetical protein PS691_04649 [Pseudomonas fluorescens]|uniref:Uncharacterized protein n=1 Tax=Pseudomonas fluorescens TaxID=294 RepID=A0A5E7EK88_PSEFL|nr:hypothetical protein PS691_04649 [Pseudomonas fluorescens]
MTVTCLGVFVPTGFTHWNKREAVALPQCCVFSRTAGRAKERLFFGQKKMDLLRGPFFNIWSGKRDSHLASNQLKSKGFTFSLKQEKTQFWTCFQGVSRVKKGAFPSHAIEFYLQPIGGTVIRPTVSMALDWLGAQTTTEKPGRAAPRSRRRAPKRLSVAGKWLPSLF